MQVLLEQLTALIVRARDARYAALPAKAAACTACGACVKRCPFDVGVIARMERAAAVFGA